MTELLSVIIPSYNPNLSRLSQTLSGLQGQTLPFDHWELIIIDNNSSPEINADLDWHPDHKIISEPKPGLTYARLKGFEQARGSLIVMVDDDNILDKDYLKNSLAIFQSNDKLGAIGGKSIPQFDCPPPTWLSGFYANLALRNLGEKPLVTGWTKEYPSFAPIGAGMGIRKVALEAYLKKISLGTSIISDRQGGSLSSGGDNDMVLEILTYGWQVGYFPALTLKHIIPEQRMQTAYLATLINNTNRSWVQVLNKHQINPWAAIDKRSVPLRKIKAWFTYRAWQNQVNYIKWQGACGLFDGLADIQKNAKA